MDERPHSKLSRLRLSALDHVVQQMSAKGGLLMLVEKQQNIVLILPSYVIGSFEEISDSLRNGAIRIDYDLYVSMSADGVTALIVRQMIQNGWHIGPEEFLLCKALFKNRSLPHAGSQVNLPEAILVLQGPQINQRNIDRYCFWIGSVIQASRDERFKDAILGLHQEIVSVGEKLEPLTDRLKQLLRDTIGPCEIEQIQPDRLTEENRRMLTDPKATWPDRANAFDPLDEDADTVSLAPNSLYVPHSELVYQLQNTKFSSTEEMRGKLSSLTHYTSAFKLTKKNVQGYLQSHFSASDHVISTVIVDMAQSLIDQSGLRSDPEPVTDLDDPGETVNAEALETDLQLLFGDDLVSLTVVDINQNGDEIELSPHSNWPSVIDSEDYRFRLQQYASEFYSNGYSAKFDLMQVGIDCTNAHRCIECHFPSSFGHGKLLIIDVRSPFISHRVLERLFNTLRTYFYKMKRMEMLAARARILIETRHSIIHYIQIAANGLKAINNQWRLAARSDKNWLELRNNKPFTDSIGNINWAIEQSSLILQSGRYTFDRINSQSIRRVNYNVETIISDCRRALDFETKRKNLIWAQKIEGFKPAAMTGDKDLLQIALLNLFDNAVKYAPNGTKISCTLSYDKDSYTLSIANRGDQILSGKLNLLLKFGFRGRQRDQLNTRSGTGLGLPVAQRILTAHSPGAKLILSSTGEDSFGLAENTFSFTIPYLTGVEHWSEVTDIWREDES